jgi:LemA protein
MLWIPIGIVVLLVGWLVVTYNRLVRMRVQTNSAWADIDVQLKRRYDLVPNLVETVKGYAGHEKETLEAVVEARNQAMAAQGPAEKGPAEGLLTQTLKSLFALSEAYPQLRAVESFTQLQESLNQIEEALQNARRYYNAVVRDLNTAVAQFPSNQVAAIFGFTGRDFFEIAAAERAAPSVSFETDSK